MTTQTDQFEQDVATAFAGRWDDDDFCRDFWCALANVDWYNTRTHDVYSCSFRYAGNLIADMRGAGDYMDWYCCGPYATVSEYIARRLKKHGWIADALPEVCDEPGCYAVAGTHWASGTTCRTTCHEHYDGKLKRPARSQER